MGVKITAKIPEGSSESFWRIGRVKARVFPVPVAEQARTFLVERIWGIVVDCTGVGVVIWREAKVFVSQSDRPRPENVDILCKWYVS